VNGGGNVTFSLGGNLLWSNDILVVPSWRNAAYAASGYWVIQCPTSGTIVSNGGTVTCTAAGIPIAGWFALYYRVVPGTSQGNVQNNFILKDNNDTTYSPDSNWILLAVRNGNTNEIKWMPGNTTIPRGGVFYTPSASFDKVQVAGTVVVDSVRTGIFNNLYSANALTTTNVFATTGSFSNALVTSNLSYSLDLIEQGAYLIPSSSNSAVITQWMDRTINTRKTPFSFVSSVSPQFGTVSSSNITGYSGSVLLNDGRVLFTSLQTANNIGFFNPKTNLYSFLSGGTITIGAYDYASVVLIPDGRVIFTPCNGNKVGIFNPVTQVLTTAATTISKNNMHYGGVYHPSGNVIMTPSYTANVGIFSTITNTYSAVSFLCEIAEQTQSTYSGSVLLPDGRVVFIPNKASNIAVYNHSTSSFSNVTAVVNGTYQGGVLLPDGNVLLCPAINSTRIGIYNPTLNTFSNVAGTAGSYFGGVLLPDGRVILAPAHNSNTPVGIYNYQTASFTTISGSGIFFSNSIVGGGATLIPDGRVIFPPSGVAVGILDTMTPAPLEFCLHPFFNKF
jgi:hypothetical protein